MSDRLITSKAIERDMADDSMWETLPPYRGPRRRLGAQITIRLTPDEADALRREAKARGIGYTQLVREIVRDFHRLHRPSSSWHYSVGGSAGTPEGRR